MTLNGEAISIVCLDDLSTTVFVWGSSTWELTTACRCRTYIMFNQQDSLWSIVKTLSTLQLLFCLILTLVVIYILFSATVILLRLRSLGTIPNGNFVRQSLALLNHRSANLGQMIAAVFYLFGLMSFLQIQIAFWTPDNGRPPSLMVLEYFREYFRFAAVIFLVFLSIHLVQWFVFCRIRTAILRLDTQVPK
jgi:hypothetical protein